MRRKYRNDGAIAERNNIAGGRYEPSPQRFALVYFLNSDATLLVTKQLPYSSMTSRLTVPL